MADTLEMMESDRTDGGLSRRIAVAAWREHAEGRQTLAFTVDVAHAHALAEAFQAAGVTAVAVSGETPRDGGGGSAHHSKGRDDQGGAGYEAQRWKMPKRES